MDAVVELDIALDLSGRKVMYDYGHERFIHKQTQDWDTTHLQSLVSQDNLDPENENLLQRRKRMDQALSDFRFMEKDAKESGSKSKDDEDKDDLFFGGLDQLQPTQIVPPRVLPFYEPGESVQGKVILELSAPVEAEAFVLSFKGQAACKIRVYHGKQFRDYRNTEKYAEEKVTLWEQANSGSVEDQLGLLSVEGQNKSKYLPPGRHEFPFNFHIPSNAIQSTVPMVDSYSDYAHVTYKLKASIEKGKKFGRGNIAFCRGIWLHRPFDIATMGEELLQPVTAAEHMNTGVFGTSGEVSMSVRLPRRAFTREEVIPVKLEVNNQTGSAVEYISVQVVLAGTVRVSRSGVRSRSINLKSKKEFVGPVGGKEGGNFAIKLPLDFSESILNADVMPGGSMNDCELIDVDYELRFVAKRPGLRRNLELTVPIVLGTENSRKDVYGLEI